MEQYRVKDWSKFQHFRDRRPPWIKLYRDILDDIEWHELDPKHAKLLVMLWLIASENDGKLPPTKTLCFRLRIKEQELNTAISALSHWLIQDDINVISDEHQDDALERETEREPEVKTEAEADPPGRVVPTPLPDWLPAGEWNDFKAMRKKSRSPMTAKAELLALSELTRLRDIGQDPKAVLEQSIMRSYKGLFPVKSESTKGTTHGKHSGFAEQDYRAGTDGFVVT